MTNNYSTERRPARKIPTREQIEAAARRQAVLEDEEEIYDDVWPPRLPTSTRRYTNVPDMQTKSGHNVRVVEHYHNEPLIQRASRTPLPQSHNRQRDTYTDEGETPVPKNKRQKRSTHPLLYLGIGMIAMLALFVLLSSAATWLQEKQNDLTYEHPRIFQIDAIVGHNDSRTNPSHFIAINLYRHVEVIEWPGQDLSKMKVYPITTLFGDGEDLTPVTLTFRDVTGDGRLDMIVHIQDTAIALINDNGCFRPAKPGEVKGIL